ncbi:MAG: hypothetical protein AB8H86_34375 [Polyangiales bacterium]
MNTPRLIASFAFVAACTGTPMPAPPIEPPPAPDIERIVIDPPTPSSPGQLLGGPGAVASGSQLFVMNLDGAEDPLLLEPMPDGSFVVATEAGTTRLEAIDAEGRRSEPVDVDEAGLVEVMLPCLELPSQLDASGELRVENRCADAVSARIALRREGEYVVLDERVELLAGDSTSIAVSAEPGGGADALLLFMESPIVERRAVTLF